jgi:broad specificity phosphatase PhoE
LPIDVIGTPKLRPSKATNQALSIERIGFTAGNSAVAMIAGVSNWLEAQSATPGAVVAVTHASLMRASVVCALECDPCASDRFSFAIGATNISTLELFSEPMADSKVVLI